MRRCWESESVHILSVFILALINLSDGSDGDFIISFFLFSAVCITPNSHLTSACNLVLTSGSSLSKGDSSKFHHIHLISLLFEHNRKFNLCLPSATLYHPEDVMSPVTSTTAWSPSIRLFGNTKVQR